MDKTPKQRLREFCDAAPVEHVQRLVDVKPKNFFWQSSSRCFTGTIAGGKPASVTYGILGSKEIDDLLIHDATMSTGRISLEAGKEIARASIRARQPHLISPTRSRWTSFRSRVRQLVGR